MTVCVAAIGNNGMSVFGASDQMITSGDIQLSAPIPPEKEQDPQLKLEAPTKAARPARGPRKGLGA